MKKISKQKSKPLNVQTNVTYKFSPSSLSVLSDCPRCFWLDFNKKIKRPRGIFPSLPSGIDRILKNHFDSYATHGEVPPEVVEITGAKPFHDQELLNKWRNNLKGIDWKDSSGNMLRGAVDNILEKGNKLIVLDYKTRGYPLKEDTARHYQNQLDLYNFLLRKNNYQTEDYAYLLFYHPSKVDTNGQVIFFKDLVKMKISVKNADKIFAKALKVLKGKIPKASKECEYCKYRETRV